MSEAAFSQWLETWGVIVLILWVMSFFIHKRVRPDSASIIRLPVFISIWFGSLDGILDLAGMAGQLLACAIGIASALLYADLISLHVFAVILSAILLIVFPIFMVSAWRREKIAGRKPLAFSPAMRRIRPKPIPAPPVHFQVTKETFIAGLVVGVGPIVVGLALLVLMTVFLPSTPSSPRDWLLNIMEFGFPYLLGLSSIALGITFLLGNWFHRY